MTLEEEVRIRRHNAKIDAMRERFMAHWVSKGNPREPVTKETAQQMQAEWQKWREAEKAVSDGHWTPVQAGQMSDKNQALEVTPYDIGRYLVESQSGGPPYLVDLAGEGSCNCWPFTKTGKCSDQANHIAAARAWEKENP